MIFTTTKSEGLPSVFKEQRKEIYRKAFCISSLKMIFKKRNCHLST